MLLKKNIGFVAQVSPTQEKYMGLQILSMNLHGKPQVFHANSYRHSASSLGMGEKVWGGLTFQAPSQVDFL